MRLEKKIKVTKKLLNEWADQCAEYARTLAMRAAHPDTIEDELDQIYSKDARDVRDIETSLRGGNLGTACRSVARLDTAVRDSGEEDTENAFGWHRDISEAWHVFFDNNRNLFKVAEITVMVNGPSYDELVAAFKDTYRALRKINGTGLLQDQEQVNGIWKMME